MAKEDGGAAFPEPIACASNGFERYARVQGMTLRDYFAAKAISGIVSGGTHGDPIDALANLAYRLADAMLAERVK